MIFPMIIRSDMTTVRMHKETMEDKVAEYTAKSLNDEDSGTTATCCASSKTAYEESQNLLNTLGEALTNDLNNFEAIGIEFETADGIVV